MEYAIATGSLPLVRLEDSSARVQIMNITKSLFCFLASAFFTTAPMFAFAQSEISRRTELQTSIVTSSQVRTTSTPNGSISDVAIASRTISSMPASGTVPPGSQVVTSEVEIITFGYQIPDFNPDELYTNNWHFSVFFENGGGNGTVNPDTDGYIEYDINLRAGQSEAQTFVYSSDVETGEAKVFIDVGNLTVNKAVEILTAVSMNSRMNAQRYKQTGAGFRPRLPILRPPEIGNQRIMQLHGEYLTLDDIQEDIFRQTRCNVEEEDGNYYLESCR